MDNDDRDLLSQLAAVVASAYPLPPAVVHDADVSYLRRSPASEIAPLTYDSVIDDELVGVRRGRSSSRHLTFEAGDSSIGVELFEERRLVGQVVPSPGSGSLEMRHALGSVTVDLDDLGRFVAEGVPTGPVSFRWRIGTGEGSVVTDWVVM
ncbi:MAG TPA: hypothetical protein VF244_08675 [Acidimicrobiales bacterium]